MLPTPVPGMITVRLLARNHGVIGTAHVAAWLPDVALIGQRAFVPELWGSETVYREAQSVMLSNMIDCEINRVATPFKKRTLK